MPLHRDIHWIGRQWAVTGHGVQLIDQKLQGFFDIEVSKLWDDVLVEAMHARDWLNTADFEKAIGIARARYPQPAGAVVAPPEVTRPPPAKPAEPIAAVAKPVAPQVETPKVETPKVATPVPAEPPGPPPTLFRMRYEGRARFVRPWRVVVRKF